MQIGCPGPGGTAAWLPVERHPWWVAGACLLVSTAMAAPAPVSATAIDVAPVWAGHPVGFALVTAGDRQAVGFYDADRRLTVAVRSCGDPNWVFVPLPRTTGWDSHN